MTPDLTLCEGPGKVAGDMQKNPELRKLSSGVPDPSSSWMQWLGFPPRGPYPPP